MDVSTALVAWLIVSIIVYFAARVYGVTWWSSLVLALFVGLLAMFLVYTPPSPDDLFEEGGLSALYALIVVITYLILIIYIVYTAMKDLDCERALRLGSFKA